MREDGYIVILGCRKCGKCNGICPNGAIYWIDGEARIHHERCNLCKKCVEFCPNKALVYMD